MGIISMIMLGAYSCVLHVQPKMKELFSSVFATKTQDEWVAVFKGIAHSGGSFSLT